MGLCRVLVDDFNIALNNIKRKSSNSITTTCPDKGRQSFSRFSWFCESVINTLGEAKSKKVVSKLQPDSNCISLNLFMLENVCGPEEWNFSKKH